MLGSASAARRLGCRIAPKDLLRARHAEQPQSPCVVNNADGHQSSLPDLGSMGLPNRCATTTLAMACTVGFMAWMRTGPSNTA